VEAVITTEMAQSHALGGRSVFGWERAEDDGRAAAVRRR
jgi:hypothetical protein